MTEQDARELISRYRKAAIECDAGSEEYDELIAAQKALLSALTAQPAAPAVVEVPLTFVQGFNTLAHNYSLDAIVPNYYHGVERDAFKNAYRRCGADLAKLRTMLAAAPTPPEGAQR